MLDKNKQFIEEGSVYLGIELGSTRIKAVLIGADFLPIASGSYDWENQLENGLWTYALADVWKGVQNSYQNLCAQVQESYGIPITKLGAMGVSAMMHGYLPFDKHGGQLVPFRTWRNTTTEEAATLLTEQLEFNIPQRWSIAHLYQAMLNEEAHVGDIALLTTLAGYVHWQLTGKKVLGVGEASGMFPIDSALVCYDKEMLARFDKLAGTYSVQWQLQDILPEVLGAGADAGNLTPEGAKLLDTAGILQPGCPLCPPEGDAGTGMVATNSVAERTGNVSAGTSIFAMVVLERALSKVYPEIDMVTTPSAKPVAMVHCNNCTSDLDAWMRIFAEFSAIVGADISKAALYDAFYFEALKGDADCGGLLSYNYYSGEPITGLYEGRPLFVRTPLSKFNLANFARCLLYSAMATLKIGMDILSNQEHVRLDEILGHGGLFKTKGVGQQLMAGALNVPLTVMESAGEGGAWGIALLAAYRIQNDAGSLEAFLEHQVFNGNAGTRVEPLSADVKGFDAFMQRYRKGLVLEEAAVKSMD